MERTGTSEERIHIMKKTILRLLCLLLACLLLVGVLTACGSSGKVLMTLGKQTMTVNMYELLLSRMKGTLEYNGYPTDEDTFWSQIISTQGATYDDYFCITIRDEAKRMLAKLYLFEEVYGLTLPQSRYDDIDQFLDDALELNFDGSKADFNSYLSAYGVNMDMLRENYVMEEKIDYLMQYLATVTGDAAREEYYNENYVCFRQILFPLYEYLYETDENGDIVYYHEGGNKICYDTSGVTKIGTNGEIITDENGDIVYFTEDGHIAYNTKDGVKMGLDEDADGYVDYEPLDEEEKQILIDRVNILAELIESGDFTTFEEYGDMWSTDDVWATYPNGIFINLNKSYEINYMDDVQEALKNMQVGDTALVESENAYHFIMKYEAESQAYADDDNADWFETFDDEVVSEILDTMCEKYIDQITVDETVLAQAKTMKTIGSNMEY